MQITRLDHVSFTVSDIDRSAAFYALFGFEPHKDYISAGPEVDDGADTERADMQIRWLRHPLGGPMLELIRYLHHPAGPAAHNSKVGAAHLCFAVDDVRAAHAALGADGVRFLSEPHEDEFGVVWVYMRDPDGNAVEIIQDPPAAAAA
jgi:catechol 2,3-dioxygenase-like lactoylglutathione lyase family enzyme